MDVTDEKVLAKDMETAKNLGLLRIGVWRAFEERQEGPGAKKDTSGLGEGCLTLAEDALKGKAISLGAT